MQKIFALSCMLHKTNKDGLSENWINVLHVVNARNKNEAIGVFVENILLENKKHSMFQRPLVVEVKQSKDK